MAMSQINTRNTEKLWEQVKQKKKWMPKKSKYSPNGAEWIAMWGLSKQNRPDSHDKADKHGDGMYGKIGKAKPFSKTVHVQTAGSKQALRDYDDRDDDDDDDYDDYDYNNYDRNPLEGVRPIGFTDDQKQTQAESQIVFVDYDGQEVSPAEYMQNGIEPYDFDPTDYGSD